MSLRMLSALTFMSSQRTKRVLPNVPLGPNLEFENQGNEPNESCTSCFLTSFPYSCEKHPPDRRPCRAQRPLPQKAQKKAKEAVTGTDPLSLLGLDSLIKTEKTGCCRNRAIPYCT